MLRAFITRPSTTRNHVKCIFDSFRKSNSLGWPPSFSGSRRIREHRSLYHSHTRLNAQGLGKLHQGESVDDDLSRGSGRNRAKETVEDVKSTPNESEPITRISRRKISVHDAPRPKKEDVHKSMKVSSSSNDSSESRTSQYHPPDLRSPPKHRQPEAHSDKDETWRIQKAALAAKFPSGWSPRKRLSPDALEGIRALHASSPDVFGLSVLAEQFKVSPEAMRRILRARWRPTAAEEEDRRVRWDRRGERIWTRLAELGTRPPKKWREMGVGRVSATQGEVPAWKKSELRRKGREMRDEEIPWAEDEEGAEK